MTSLGSAVWKLVTFGIKDDDESLVLAERTPEEIRERRRGDALKARIWALLAVAATIGIALPAYLDDIKWLQVVLVVSSGVLGVTLDRMGKRSDDERQLTQDVVALTAIYYQSPGTIRHMLRADYLDRAIENLLNAAIGDSEIGSAFWEQSVAPFIHKRGSGYKQDWRYLIDLVDLDEPIKVEIGGAPYSLPPEAYRRLHTSVTYTQTVAHPPEIFYIAVVFDGAALPAWFERENFWLRELNLLPADVISALRAMPPTPDLLPTAWSDVPDSVKVTEVLSETENLAGSLMRTTVSFADQILTPKIMYLDSTGLSWGFVIDEDSQAKLRDGCEVHVELETFIPRSMRYFPVNINAPTKHPTIQFTYARTDIPVGGVDAEIFFASQRPYDSRLRTHYKAGKRMVVRTEGSDWVFRGSGCIFTWDTL
jgi:hypothetical protein